MLYSKIRDELSGILPGQLHPFGRRAAMRCLRGAADAWMSLAEEEAQMGTERRPLPGFKKLFFYIHQIEGKLSNFQKALFLNEGSAVIHQLAPPLHSENPPGPTAFLSAVYMISTVCVGVSPGALASCHPPKTHIWKEVNSDSELIFGVSVNSVYLLAL